MVRFVPDAQQGGAYTFGFRAWDQTTGTHGTTVNALTFGGSTAFSSAGDVAHITVNNVNDAPVLNTVPALTFGTVNEDAGAPVGAVGVLLSSLVDLTPPSGELDNVTDADNPSSVGAAIVGVDEAHGKLWYSADNRLNWVTYNSVSESNAILIPANSR